MDTDPEIPQKKEERFWYVDGTIRYTLKDGSRHPYRFVLRNVAAFDIQDAADYCLENIPRALSEMKGLEIVDACWESEPKISSFDPYIDR